MACPFRVRELSSHEAFVLAVEDGRIVRLFHYVHDPDGFAAFSASRVCRCPPAEAVDYGLIDEVIPPRSRPRHAVDEE